MTGISLFSRLYDPVMKAADRAGLADWRRELAGRARGRVIEVGAGTGLQFAHYPPGTDVYAIEPDLAMLEQAKGRRDSATARIALVAADARALPFPDQTFDGAVVAMAFCTIPEPARAASEMRRVLRPTGVAQLLEHVRAEQRWIASLQRRLTPLWSRIAGGCQLARPTAEVIAGAGFDVKVRRSALRGVVVELEARPR